MQDIANLIHSKVEIVDRTYENKGITYLIRSVNYKSNLSIVNYLTNYPLFSSKYLDFLNYKEVVSLFSPRFEHTNKNIEIVLKNKLSMNNNRTVFN